MFLYKVHITTPGRFNLFNYDEDTPLVVDNLTEDNLIELADSNWDYTILEKKFLVYKVKILNEGYFTLFGHKFHSPGIISDVNNSQLSYLKSSGWEFEILESKVKSRLKDNYNSQLVNQYFTISDPNGNADFSKIKSIQEGDRVINLDTGQEYLYYMDDDCLPQYVALHPFSGNFNWHSLQDRPTHTPSEIDAAIGKITSGILSFITLDPMTSLPLWNGSEWPGSSALKNKADEVNVILKGDNTPYEPQTEYDPVNKAYVDNLIQNLLNNTLMYKSVYDSDNDGIVDKANEALKVNWINIYNAPNEVLNFNVLLNNKADKTDVLIKNSNIMYTPQLPYDPATKDYVDQLFFNRLDDKAIKRSMIDFGTTLTQINAGCIPDQGTSNSDKVIITRAEKKRILNDTYYESLTVNPLASPHNPFITKLDVQNNLVGLRHNDLLGLMGCNFLGSSKEYYHLDAMEYQKLILSDNAAFLTNKTIDADNNTILNIENAITLLPMHKVAGLSNIIQSLSRPIMQKEIYISGEFDNCLDPNKDLFKEYEFKEFYWVCPDAKILDVSMKIIQRDTGSLYPTITIKKNGLEICAVTSLLDVWKIQSFNHLILNTNDILTFHVKVNGRNRDSKGLCIILKYQYVM